MSDLDTTLRWLIGDIVRQVLREELSAFLQSRSTLDGTEHRYLSSKKQATGSRSIRRRWASGPVRGS